MFGLIQWLGWVTYLARSKKFLGNKVTGVLDLRYWISLKNLNMCRAGL